MSQLVIIREFRPDPERAAAALLMLIERRLARLSAAGAPRANAAGPDGDGAPAATPTR